MQLNVPFDLDFTLCCGQVFRWHKKNDWWYGVVRDHVFKVKQSRGTLDYENVEKDFIWRYFGLNDDLKKIGENIGKDSYIKQALRRFEGLRLIRQDPWECLISYICATYKSIPAIKRMLNNIAQKFGEKVDYDSMCFYTFPSMQKLACASESELRACGLGYRAKYVCDTARKIQNEPATLESLKSLPYQEAKKKLLEFPGVGLKVADCVLLFSLGKTEAFPIDVWVKRVLLKHYDDCFPEALIKKMTSHKSLTNGEYKRLNGFGRAYFGEYAGYAQEYLYHNERVRE